MNLQKPTNDWQPRHEDVHRLRELIEQYALKRGHFTLSSGATSSIYLDCRAVCLRPEGSHIVGSLIWDYCLYLRQCRHDVVAVGGLTLGADPMVMAAMDVSYAQAPHGGQAPLLALMVRAQSKGHGMGQAIEGLSNVAKGAKVLLVDDVITSGRSVGIAAQQLLDHGLQPVAILALIDREATGKAYLARFGVPVVSVLSWSELL